MPARTRSLTVVQIHEFVRQSCFAPSNIPAGPVGTVGVELELLTLPIADPACRPSLDHLLAAAVDAPQGSHITLEPGGQIELSSSPQPGLSAAIAATEADLGVLHATLRASGIATAAVGLDFVRPHERIIGGGRYEAMEAYFGATGKAGRAMMCGTASVQVNLDMGDETSMARRWRLAHALGPVLVASFANSPLTTAGPTGAKSTRQQIWASLDASRAAPVTAARASSSLSPAEHWARYAMAAGVMVMHTSSGVFHPVSPGLSFAAWMTKGHEYGYPTLDDFAYHLTTLFPPVRPKGWLELRMIDAVPDPWWQVAVAVTTALLDDPGGFEVAERTCRPIADCWAAAAAHGLMHPGLASAAKSCFAAAIEALPKMGATQALMSSTTEYVDRYIDRARTPGDDLLDAWIADPECSLLSSAPAGASANR